MGAPNPNRTHFNASTAKGASHASFAQQLRHWFYNTQAVYATQEAFAAALEVNVDTLRPYLNGKTFPSDPICDRLHSLTQLPCFSPESRIAARAEHLGKKGLSHAAILKRAKRKYLLPEELAECIADPDKAFTIRGDEWIACLECGQLLRFIRGKGAAVHLSEHGILAEQYREKWGYSKSTGLVCRALAGKKRLEAEARANLRPDAGLANLRPQQKGWKVSREFKAKQANLKRGQRNPEWAKPVDDVEFVWAWLVDGKDLEEVAQVIGKLSPDGKFTIGGVHGRLKHILGTPVRRRLLPEDEHNAARAARLVHGSAGDDSRLKAEIASLCGESRREVKDRKDLKARRTLLWIPVLRSWKAPDSTLSADAFARLFLATGYRSLKKNPVPKKRGPKPEKTAMFIEAKRLHDSGRFSWAKIARQLTPDEFSGNPRKAGEAMRQGVLRLKK